jgi:nucleoside 2-deoxyribosyltransferase
MKTIYISGGISGLPFDEVRKRFDAAKEYYKQIGYKVVSPLDLPHKHDHSWSSFMLQDLRALSKCDEIAMLENWQKSTGARIEYEFAVRMEKPVRYFYAPKIGDHLNPIINYDSTRTFRNRVREGA